MSRPITVMVSSSVYGLEEVLDQVFGVLTAYGFKVWMSHKGTIPLTPGVSAFQNCLNAVTNCDILLGIISGRYGSGKIGDDLSVTHQEILRAIELGKPRFLLVHNHVVIARQLLQQFRNDADGRPRHHSFFKATPILDDIRVIDLYDAAIRTDTPLADRKDNWVQPYVTRDDVLLFVKTQLSDLERIRLIIEGKET